MIKCFFRIVFVIYKNVIKKTNKVVEKKLAKDTNIV